MVKTVKAWASVGNSTNKAIEIFLHSSKKTVERHVRPLNCRVVRVEIREVKRVKGAK